VNSVEKEWKGREGNGREGDIRRGTPNFFLYQLIFIKKIIFKKKNL